MGRPFALAGGLTPENLPEAIRAIHPQLVDLSSGVETDKKKDREKMRRAVAAART
jgi:phosphoribosylanthranilate isomerase